MKNEEYTIKNISFETPRVIDLELVKNNLSPVFNYQPGQYAMIAYRKNGVRTSWHPFTIASSPSERGSLKFGIKTFGKFTQRLSQLSAGDTIYIKGPYGNFTFDENAYEKRVFIAGGIGITPFLSALKYANDNDFKSKMTLIYTTQSLTDLAFVEDIKKLEKENDNFTAHFVIKNVDNKEKLQPNMQCGRVDIGMLHSILGPDVKDSLFLLCGPTPFMKAMQGNLKVLGAPSRKIKFESFATNSISIKANYKIFIPALGVSALLLFFALNSISLAAEKKFIAKKVQESPSLLVENQNTANTINSDLQSREKIFIINDKIISRMTRLLNEKEAKIIELNKKRLALLEERTTINALNLPVATKNPTTPPVSSPTPKPAPTIIRRVVTKSVQATPPLIVKTPPPVVPIIKIPPPAPTPTPRTTVS